MKGRRKHWNLRHHGPLNFWKNQKSSQPCSIRSKYISHLEVFGIDFETLKVFDRELQSGLTMSIILLRAFRQFLIKFMFCKKTTKNYLIFTVDLTLKLQIDDGEDFVIFVDFLENMNFMR